MGLNLLHDRGGDLLFFFSLRESTTMWMSRLADVPGSVAGGSIEAREDGPRGGVVAGARAHDAHHDCLLVSDASSRRTDVRGPDDRAAGYLFSSHRYFSSQRASGLFGADEEPRPRGDAFIIPFHPRSDPGARPHPFARPSPRLPPHSNPGEFVRASHDGPRHEFARGASALSGQARRSLRAAPATSRDDVLTRPRRLRRRHRDVDVIAPVRRPPRGSAR